MSSIDALFGKWGELENTAANDMKRVLLLVLLIVSLVDRDWERDRICLLSSLPSLVLVLSSERMRYHKAEKAVTARALTPAEAVSPLSLMAYSQRARDQADEMERVESYTAVAPEEVICVTTRS